MELDKLIDFCKHKFPKKAVEICEGIDLIIDTLNNLKSDIGKSVPVLFEINEYDSVDEYKNHAKQIANLIQILNNISNDITLDDAEENEQEDIKLENNINTSDIN